MKHAIVTGGGGSIGSRLVRRLLDDGVMVRVLDDFSSGFQWLLPKDHPNLFVELFDISEPRSEGKLRRRITSGADVYHLAANFANANSVEHPIRDLEVNGSGTLRVLLAAAQAKAAKVVFASAGCAANHEDTPYQINKSLGEAYCRYMSKEIQIAACRFHNSYGEGEVPGKWRNVIPNWMWAAMHDQPLTIYGDGSDSRDYIYVEDLISRMIKAQTGGVTVLGTGTLTKTSKLAEMIVDITKSKSQIVYALRRRWDHAGQSQHQSETFTKLEDGLKKTLAWMEDEYENIKRSIIN